MTTTTITASSRTRSMSAMVHDAFHVRARVAQPSDAKPAGKTAPRRTKPNGQQSMMLTTFAGRYGGLF